MKKSKKPSKCLDCGKELSKSKYKRYTECNGRFHSGQNNPMYKHGKTYDNRCKDCGTLLGDSRSTYCKKCMNKGKRSYLYKNGKGCEPINCKTCGKQTTRHSIQCRKCANQFKRIGKKHTEFSKNKMKNSICEHHIFGKKFKDTIKINKNKHMKLHHNAYFYILEKFGKQAILDYIKWFDKKYGLKLGE